VLLRDVIGTIEFIFVRIKLDLRFVSQGFKVNLNVTLF
jgi:hypothetical protein